jgi:hypothetical protein
MEVFPSQGGLSVSKKTTALVLVAILTSLSILGLPLHDVRAQAGEGNWTLSGINPYAMEESFFQCADLGGTWSNATVTCTIQGRALVSLGSTLRVDSGATLVVKKGGNLANSGLVYINGTVINNGLFTSVGTIINFGLFTNGGTFTNSAGVFSNSGTISNSGTMSNSNIFYNMAGGTIITSGVITGNTIDSSGGGTITYQSASTTLSSSSSSSPSTIAIGVILVLVVVGGAVFFLRRGGIILAGKRTTLPAPDQPHVEIKGVQWINIRTGAKIRAIEEYLPPEGATPDKTDPTRAFNEQTGTSYTFDSENKTWTDVATGEKVAAVEEYLPPEGATLDKADPNSAYNSATGARYVIYDPGRYMRSSFQEK